ncbi:MAG: hypothetical protein ABI629_25225 [bacterium]
MIRLLALLFASWCAVATAAAAGCPGDCNGDGVVTIDEIISGVAIALGTKPTSVCAAFDRDADGSISINELLAAVNALLSGCPGITPSVPTPSRTATTSASSTPGAPTATDTARPSSTPTTTSTPIQPPLIPTPFVYRGFAGFPIALPLGAVDPGGGPLTCSADDLIDGMTLGGDAVLRWTPNDEQLGPQLIPFTCSNGADPPLPSAGALAFEIAAHDACAMPVCDEAAGCTSTLPSPMTKCCTDAVAPRVAEFTGSCPLGLSLEIGQNSEGFGALQNCDQLYVRNFAQSQAELAFHIRVSCVSPLVGVRVTAQLQSSARGEAVNSEIPRVYLPVEPTNGFFERRNVRFPVNGPGPFNNLDNAEGNLTVTVSEQPPSTVSVTRTIRVRTTFEPQPDRPD